tara:strand:- start:341 stop:568 length:228 start_codon:yes stop_codon:yes gene_type:complete
VKIKIGDLVEDIHYGVGTVMDADSSPRGEWVKALFPKFPNLAPGGVINLWNEHVRELKIISRACEKSEINLNNPE